MKALILAAALVFASAAILPAIEVRLEISSETASIGEPVYLQVHISDPAGSDCIIDFPPSPAFTRKEAGVSQNHTVRIINSKVERTSTWTRNWMLVPQQAGQFILGPARCTIGGRTFTTQTVKLEVSATAKRPAPRALQRRGLFDLFDQDPFGQQAEEETDIAIETSFDRTSAWVGEQVIHYVDILATKPSVIKVEFAQIQRHGFWEVKPDSRQQPKPERIRRDGRDWYRYRYLSGFIFPLTPGKKIVDPFAVRIDYDRFWPRSRVLQTDQVSLQVRALPDDATGKFSGAVGLFVLEGELDAAEGCFVRDLPFLMTVRLKGTGNLRAAGEPVMTPTTNFRVMQPQSETEVRAEAGGLYGTREWKYLVYPLATGRLDLPEASLRVFDPVKASWTDLVYTPGTVSVSPSTKTNSDSGQLSEVLPKIDCPLPQSDSLPVAISLQMALAILFPALLWCIIAIIIARLRTRREADTTGYAKRTAGKAALSSLRGDSKNADIPALVENVLRNYAIQRTMAPPGVTTEGLASFLREAGIKLDAVDRWQALLDKAVSFRYAGVISDPEQLLVEARQIIRDMEIQS